MIYLHIKNLTSHNLLKSLSHPYIIDPNNNYLNKGIFKNKVLDEIRDYKAKPIPQMSKELLQYLNTCICRVVSLS